MCLAIGAQTIIILTMTTPKSQSMTGSGLESRITKVSYDGETSSQHQMCVFVFANISCRGSPLQQLFISLAYTIIFVYLAHTV